MMEEVVSGLKAIVVRAEAQEALKVGGITLTQRWQALFSDQGVEAIFVSLPDLREALENVASPVVLALGNGVVEPAVLETQLARLDECEDIAVHVVAAPGLQNPPLMLMGAAAARALSKELGSAPPTAAQALHEMVGGLPGITVSQTPMPAATWSEVVDDISGKEATWRLLKRLQFRPGGLVAKYVNRPISIRFSKHLLNTSVTPNQTTWFAFGLGLLGVWFVVLGGYWNIVVGAALLQLNSIVDGIDGELARIRHQSSSYGAYLDSVCDEILNMMLYMAVGYSLVARGYPDFYLWLGIFVGTVVFLYAAIHWHCKWKHGLGFYWWFEAYKPRKQVQQDTSFFFYFKHLFWKESYLLIFLLLAFFQAEAVLLWMAFPATIAVVVLFIIHIPIKRARW
jgi:phosphatidylglycerophosphate synthase